MLALHVDHGQEIIECLKRGGRGDVVDEEEGIRAEIGGSPETTIFFLPGGVGEGEVVRLAVNDASDGVGVLCTTPLCQF